MDDPSNKIVRKFIKIEKTYWEMTPEEQSAYIKGILRGFSPNDELRNSEED